MGGHRASTLSNVVVGSNILWIKLNSVVIDRNGGQIVFEPWIVFAGGRYDVDNEKKENKKEKFSWADK